MKTSSHIPAYYVVKSSVWTRHWKDTQKQFMRKKHKNVFVIYVVKSTVIKVLWKIIWQKPIFTFQKMTVSQNVINAKSLLIKWSNLTIIWSFVQVTPKILNANNVIKVSMTTLLTHTVAHSTKPSFMPKTNNQPPKKFLSVVLSWAKVVKYGKILTFKVNFLCQKISEYF